LKAIPLREGIGKDICYQYPFGEVLEVTKTKYIIIGKKVTLLFVINSA
jgi:hypothetical protein